MQDWRSPSGYEIEEIKRLKRKSCRIKYFVASVSAVLAVLLILILTGFIMSGGAVHEYIILFLVTAAVILNATNAFILANEFRKILQNGEYKVCEACADVALGFAIKVKTDDFCISSIYESKEFAQYDPILITKNGKKEYVKNKNVKFLIVDIRYGRKERDLNGYVFSDFR